MKQIVIKIPGVVFLIAIFLPAILFTLWNYNYIDGDLRTILQYSKIIQFSFTGIWYMSILAYFSHEKQSFQGNSFVYALILLSTITGIVLIPIFGYSNAFLPIPLAIMVYPIVKVILRVREVFYARSLWFLVFEILIPPIGFLTLTPEIKRWEKSDKV